MACFRNSRRLVFIALTGSALALCPSVPALAQAPGLASLTPSEGAERSLVIIQGSGLDDAVVVWDAGLASETKFARPVLGATMFSVPPDSKPGKHPVAVESAAGRSSPVTFTVAGPPPRGFGGYPRIDGVTLLNANFDEPGKVKVALYVQGANIDVGARLLIDGVETASSAHKTIAQNLFGADPGALGYPIRHYLSRIVGEITRPLGSEISLKIVNERGETSAGTTYRLPENSKTFSSAGDGIADDQKINGYDNGHGRIDLKALGADPYRKIIFLQMDIMDGVPRPVETTGDAPGAVKTVQAMFANAPIINPYGANGIDLVVDTAGSVPHSHYLGFVDEDEGELASFWKLKKQHFDEKRVGLYHYAIWGSSQLGSDSSGYSNVDFDGCNVGDSFMITMGEFPVEFQEPQSQAEAIAHELGHNLGQRHGGTNHSRYKPNYWSIMSYAWQFRSKYPDTYRQQTPVCTQVYYVTPGAVEKNGQLPPQRKFRLDYSEGMGPMLHGTDGSLDEKAGVCGQPIDWNRNGKIDAAPVSARIDFEDGDDAYVQDSANWPNLRFDGPKRGGSRYPL